MNGMLVLAVGLLGLYTVWAKGVRWTFLRIYLPILVLVPHEISWKAAGVPELTCQGILTLALYAGGLIGYQELLFGFRWSGFDLLALVPVLTFSISYGMETGMEGFLNRVPLLAFNWGGPYLLTRALIRNADELRAFLRAVGISAIVLAFLAVWECRMAVRLAPQLWTLAGFTVYTEPHLDNFRWGFLRAAASFTHPIYLGTFFATIVPLVILWALLDTRYRRWATGAVLACLAGGIASLSRGPIMVMFAVTALSLLAGLSRQILILLVLLSAVLLTPFVSEALSNEMQSTQEQMDTIGNTTSGRYRIALLMIYGRQLDQAGWFGNTAILTERAYERAWSIDNSYLLLFITGGWLGGGAFCIIILLLLYWSARHLMRKRVPDRNLYTPIVASFLGVTCCMIDVWFAPEYASFFWISAALIVNFTGEEKQRYEVPVWA
jgi:hypothetical protein